MALRHGVSGRVVSIAEPCAAAAPPRTQAVIKGESLEVVQLVLPAGSSLPMHAAPGEITLFGLSGTLTVELGDRTLRIGPGDLLHLARGEPHAVRTAGGARALPTLCLHRVPPARTESATRPTGPRRPEGAPVPGAAGAEAHRLQQQKEPPCI